MVQEFNSGYEWIFDPDRSDDGILVDDIDNDMPEYRAGKRYNADLVFWENEADETGVEAETGGTVGGAYTDAFGDTTPTGFTVGGSYTSDSGDTVATGATAGSKLDTGTHIDRYTAVREYTRWAGRYALTTAIDGTPRYSEHTPSSASVDSIVVNLDPGPEYDDTPGLWIILDDVTDQTRFVQDFARLQIRFTVLARGDEYDSRSALESALASDL